MSSVFLGTTVFFAGLSLISGVLNAAFLVRAYRNYTSLLLARVKDPELHRIGSGFMFVWCFIVFADVVRVATGAGILLHQDKAIYLLLLSPIGSFFVAVIGLRSFR